MKKVGLLFVTIGIFLCFYGGYSLQNVKEEKKVDGFNYFSSVTDEEQKEVLNFLKLKYNLEFEVLEHTTRFCLDYKDDNYEVNLSCNNADLIEDLYKIKDKDGITFFVKKVKESEAFDKSDNTESNQISGYYDNYVTYKAINRYEKELVEIFKILGNLVEINIYDGLGVERADYKVENGKYSYYVLYKDLGVNSQRLVDVDIPFMDYINFISNIGIPLETSLHIRVSADLTSENIKDIVKTIVENKDFITMKYGIISQEILFEYNDKYFIKYLEGNSLEILKYDKNIFEDGERVYVSVIVLDYSDVSEDKILYDRFISLDKIDLRK